MLRAELRPRVFALLAGLLCAAFVLQSFLVSRVKSPGADESPHFGAGLSYVQTGKFVMNPQHPPLLKELSAAFALISGARWPNTPEAQRALQGERAMDWSVGNAAIAAYGADNVLFWGRLPMTLVAAMTAVLLFVWGRELFGAAAAVGAVFLYALDPTIVAHSFSITFDIGVAAFSVLFLFALWRYLHYPSLRRLLWCGVALGAALGAKFSAVFLLPIAGILLAAAALRPPEHGAAPAPKLLELYAPGRKIRAKAAPNDPCPCGSGKKFKKCHGLKSAAPLAGPGMGGAVLRVALVLGAMVLVAAVVVEAVYFFPGDPLLYWKGLKQVNADHNPNYMMFLAGDFQRRFLSYFAAAYLLKEPLASIAFVALGLVALVRSRSVSLLAKLFVLVPAAVFFVSHTFLADNIGIRYIIPALPFAYLIGGVGIASLFQGAAWKRAVAGVLCAWIVIAAVGIFPDGLSYFNESACLLDNPRQLGWDGGSRCGIRWLDDSNVDWGQGLKQLRAWMDRNAKGRKVYLLNPLSLFSPRAYGLDYEQIDSLSSVPAPGLYAISAHAVVRYPNTWLQQIPPSAIVGHCLYVYDIPAPVNR